MEGVERKRKCGDLASEVWGTRHSFVYLHALGVSWREYQSGVSPHVPKEISKLQVLGCYCYSLCFSRVGGGGGGRMTAVSRWWLP